MSLNILVVDDNPGDRTLVRRYFSRAGEDVRVQEVESGQEALVYLKGSEPIDCVFLDYGLPDRDGISVLKEVYDKESDIGPFPIVMLTGQGHAETHAFDAEDAAVLIVRFKHEAFTQSHDPVRITA